MPSRKKKDQPLNKFHPHGPLKRTGSQAEAWDKHVGGSLDQLPATQLPQVRTVLRLYRGLRTTNELKTKRELALDIANKLVVLWQKARVPTVSLKEICDRVCEAIDFWNNSSKKPKSRDSDRFSERLNALLDLAPKPKGRGGNVSRENEFVKGIMKSQGKKKKRPLEKKNEGDGNDSDWEKDFEFYKDQKVNSSLCSLIFLLLCLNIFCWFSQGKVSNINAR